ncbi:hypothetical protein ZWY2020_035646 [Hordeum vulgare]|nr:hypothetical protein ZWY2020_035646 [Hordeum vulgare]
MMLICDAAVAEYPMCLLTRDTPVEVVMAFMCSVERPCCFDNGAMASCVGIIQHVIVC